MRVRAAAAARLKVCPGARPPIITRPPNYTLRCDAALSGLRCAVAVSAMGRTPRPVGPQDLSRLPHPYLWRSG